MYYLLTGQRVLGDARRMSEHSSESSRLSGWVRLWIVFSVISWLLGGIDVSLSFETFEWPVPLGEMTPQSVRHLMWFLGPILMAIVWISFRWVWLGFRPSADQVEAQHMSAAEILKRAFMLVQAVIGITIGLSAIAIVAVIGYVTTEGMEASEMSDTWWGGILVTFHVLFFVWIILSIWEWITGSSND